MKNGLKIDFIYERGPEITGRGVKHLFIPRVTLNEIEKSIDKWMTEWTGNGSVIILELELIKVNIDNNMEVISSEKHDGCLVDEIQACFDCKRIFFKS